MGKTTLLSGQLGSFLGQVHVLTVQARVKSTQHRETTNSLVKTSELTYFKSDYVTFSQGFHAK